MTDRSAALRALRQRHALTLDEMGALLGVDRTTVHRWEARTGGREAPPWALRLALLELGEAEPYVLDARSYGSPESPCTTCESAEGDHLCWTPAEWRAQR